MTTRGHQSTATQPGSSGSPSTSNAVGLGPRSLITIGIFAAIYCILEFLTGMFALLSPVMLLVGFCIGIFANGTVIQLFLIKVRAFGAMTILGFILGVFKVATGHFWGTVILTTVLGLIADLIVRSGGYRSKARNILAYGVFQLWMIGPLLPIFLDPTGYRNENASMMGTQYADTLMRVFSPTMVLVYEALFFVVAIIAAWVGTRILERNLAHAGIL